MLNISCLAKVKVQMQKINEDNVRTDVLYVPVLVLTLNIRIAV
jgi:hypothetical protein